MDAPVATLRTFICESPARRFAALAVAPLARACSEHHRGTAGGRRREAGHIPQRTAGVVRAASHAHGIGLARLLIAGNCGPA